MNLKDIKEILSFNLIVLVIFLIYIELTIGNIWYRISSNGYRNINLIGLFSYLIDPLCNKFLWNTELLDVNYIFILILSNLFYIILKI